MGWKDAPPELVKNSSFLKHKKLRFKVCLIGVYIIVKKINKNKKKIAQKSR